MNPSKVTESLPEIYKGPIANLINTLLSKDAKKRGTITDLYSTKFSNTKLSQMVSLGEVL